MRVVWVLGVAQLGCRTLLGFEDPALPDPSIDAPIVDANQIDTTDPRVCAVATNGTPVARGRAGGNGGGVNFPPLACPTGELPIGVALRMSDQVTTVGARSAHGITITCGAVSVDATGGTVGATSTTSVQGTGQFGWTPATLTPTTFCRDGWILSGLAARTGSSGELFVNVSIECTQLSPSGAQLALETIPVTGSLVELSGATSATCNGGEVAVQLANHTGAGLDSLDLFCAPVGCAP